MQSLSLNRLERKLYRVRILSFYPWDSGTHIKISALNLLGSSTVKMQRNDYFRRRLWLSEDFPR